MMVLESSSFRIQVFNYSAVSFLLLLLIFSTISSVSSPSIYHPKSAVGYGLWEVRASRRSSPLVSCGLMAITSSWRAVSCPFCSSYSISSFSWAYPGHVFLFSILSATHASRHVPLSQAWCQPAMCRAEGVGVQMPLMTVPKAVLLCSLIYAGCFE